MSQLTLDSVSAGYGRVHILEELSLTLGSEEALGVVGPNGSGKSTLLKTIMGLTTLYAGTIKWGDYDLTLLPTHRRIPVGLGYVPQTNNVFSGLSILENLHMGAYLRPSGSVAGELERVFHLFPRLYERRSNRAGSLSGGERRMLALGMTLMSRPRCLILDEPTSDLAPAAIDVVFQKIREIREEYSLPMLIVEQNVHRVLELVGRICVLVRGKKVLDEPSSSVTEAELGSLFLH